MIVLYRNEGSNFKDIVRLWDFTVREMVFVGEKDYVESSLNNIAKKAMELLDMLGIVAELKNANDHFYPTRINALIEKTQRANMLKKEIVVKIENNNIAIASFNIHNYHFSKTFNFDNSGKVVTGCVGFGMERCLALLLENNISVNKIENVYEDGKN